MISDGPCTTECDSGDWSARVKQEHLSIVKQEPQDVCMMHCYKCVLLFVVQNKVNLYNFKITILEIAAVASALQHEAANLEVAEPIHYKWKLSDSDQCSCVETQTISHIVESCPQTRLHGGLSNLHSTDDDAVAWLTSYGS